MYKLLCVALLLSLGVALQSGCATKKYVRNRVAERVTPLENRTSELEETSRRNTQQISELKTGVDDARMRADKAQSTADHASSSAEQANTRVAGVERNVEDLRANLDKYTLQGTTVVFFKAGNAVLTSEVQAQLDAFTSRITDRRGFVLEIVGFGDSDKDNNYNQRLAQLRAEAVERYLADKGNIPLMRMFSAGFGPARPMMQNASVSNTSSSSGTAQTLPRRVEIHLFTTSIGERPATKTGPSGASDSTQHP